MIGAPGCSPCSVNRKQRPREAPVRGIFLACPLNAEYDKRGRSLHTDPERKCKLNKREFQMQEDEMVAKLNLAGGYLFIPVTAQTDSMCSKRNESIF